ncbi:MAG: DICT sensory domain-containing protein [Solirubrobacteraceae bacterium]
MSHLDEPASLSIGELAARTGVGEGTLRMWEARHDFPAPQRLPSGHRRYSPRELERVASVRRAREEGLSLAVAIERVRRLEAEPRPSVYGAIRDRFDHLHPQLLPKPALMWLSHAIEDECCSRAARPLLFACFQQERFYRQAEGRWRTLAATAERAVVLADFRQVRRPKHAAAEVPIAQTDPLMREWVVVCEAGQHSACMIAWERPMAQAATRVFETIWSVETEVVREAARVCCDLIARRAADLVADLRNRLADQPAATSSAQARGAVALASRILAYASAGAMLAQSLPDPAQRRDRGQP